VTHAVGPGELEPAHGRQDDHDATIALDLPAVLVSTRQAVAAAGRADRYTVVGADIFDEPGDGGAYDRAIARNRYHLFDEAANRRLLARLHDALRPYRRVDIVDILLRGLMARAAVLYALGLLLRTTTERIYPFTPYVGWLRATGFEAVERHDVGGAPPLSLIVAPQLYALRGPSPRSRRLGRAMASVAPSRTVSARAA